MEAFHVEVDDIVRIDPQFLKHYGADSPMGVKIIDFTLDARISCIFKRYEQKSSEYNNIATIHFLNTNHSTLINVRVEHLIKVVTTKYRRDKFIRLLKRMTQEDRELLMAENCYCF